MATLKQNYTTGSDTAHVVTTVSVNAQTFSVTSSYVMRYTRLAIKRSTTLPGDLEVAILGTLSGVPIGSGAAGAFGSIIATATMTNTSIGTLSAWVTISTFNVAASLVSGTVYAIAIRALSSAISPTKVYSWLCDQTAATYSGGSRFYQNEGPSGYWAADLQDDFMFEIYGDPAPPKDKRYTRSVIAVGGNEVWYESSTGTMALLTASVDDPLSCVYPMTATEMNQKIFIANWDKFRVFDNKTTKLSTAEIGAAGITYPTYQAMISGQTSGAGMVVDFVSKATGSAYVYGFLVSTVAFTSGEIVQDVGGTLSVSFTLLSTEAGPPHWYAWTPYANDTTNFGSMPTKGYLTCRYRGRVMLAGHPDYPHMWYMPKIGQPFNWIFNSLDPLTAVSGQDADAGEVGDIIRAVIPYGDDFLIFGCADSIHILDGDPASSGSIDEISDNTGIHSPWAWCKDDDGNLYFYGSNGVYIMEGGRSKPRLISDMQLPRLVEDWAIDPNLHRVVLTWVSSKQAVLVTKTTLGTGACEGYFYYLATKGWYPVTFPDGCGIYCSEDSQSDDPDYDKLLFGTATGYINSLDDNSKNDSDGVTTNLAISAYIVFPAKKFSGDEDVISKINSFQFVNAGGASATVYPNSDGFVYEWYVADDGETLLENIENSATPFLSGTETATGRGSKHTDKIRGNYIGLKLINDTADQYFAINRVSVNVVEAVSRI